MNDALQQVISDAEIEGKHWGNWGSMTPREVVNEGVLKYAHGFSSGYTQLQILLAHKLLKKPKHGSYRADLTQKGKAYARALWNRRADLPATPAQIAASPEVRALVDVIQRVIADPHWRTTDNTLWPDMCKALAAFKPMEAGG